MYSNSESSVDLSREEHFNVSTSNAQRIVQTLWNYCNILRDDGLSRSYAIGSFWRTSPRSPWRVEVGWHRSCALGRRAETTPPRE